VNPPSARVALVVQRAKQRRGVRLERAGTERDQDEADGDAGQARYDGERDVTCHHDDAAVEHHPLHAEKPVGHPAAEHRRQVHQAAVGADDPGGSGFRQLEAALGHRVVEVVTKDGEHPVEREALPHLDAEEVHQADRMPEDGPFWSLLTGDGCGHAAHPATLAPASRPVGAGGRALRPIAG
jgi:hypothetical protein